MNRVSPQVMSIARLPQEESPGSRKTLKRAESAVSRRTKTSKILTEKRGNKTPSPNGGRNGVSSVQSKTPTAKYRDRYIGPSDPDSNSSLSPLRRFDHIPARIDSGLPRRRPAVNLSAAFSALLSPSENRPFSSFSSTPTTTADLLTMEELVRRRTEVAQSPYDVLVQRLIMHYVETDPEKYEAEISLLKSLLGTIDQGNLSALALLPGLPIDVKSALGEMTLPGVSNEDKGLAEAETDVMARLSQLTVRRISLLRGLTHPPVHVQQITAAYLCLFSRADSSIEVAPGFQLVLSRCWETWQAYIQQPGHVIQTARTVLSLVKTGKITQGIINEVKRLLKDVNGQETNNPAIEEAAETIFRFLKSVETFFSEWKRRYPELYPKRTRVNIAKSADRLSKVEKRQNPEVFDKRKPTFSPGTRPQDVDQSYEKQPWDSEEKEIRLPSFGPGGFNVSENVGFDRIPELDFEAVITEPLDCNPSFSSVRENEVCTTRIKDDREKTEFASRKTVGNSIGANGMMVEWEIELALRRLVQKKIRENVGDLSSLSVDQLQGAAWIRSGNLFSELKTAVLTSELRRKCADLVGEETFLGILEEFKGKLADPQYAKREIAKTVLRLKTETETLERGKHLEKMRSLLGSQKGKK